MGGTVCPQGVCRGWCGGAGSQKWGLCGYLVTHLSVVCAVPFQTAWLYVPGGALNCQLCSAMESPVSSQASGWGLVCAKWPSSPVSLVIPDHCYRHEFWRINPKLCSHCFKLRHWGSERAFQPTFTVLHIVQMIADSLWYKQDYSRAIRFGESKPSFLQQHGNFSVSSYRFWIVHYHAVIYLVKNQEGSIITLTENYIIENGNNSTVTNHLQSQIRK